MDIEGVLDSLWNEWSVNKAEIKECQIDILPECVRSSLLQDGLLVIVEKVSRVQHVKEVELGQHWHWCLQECIISCCALPYCQLLKIYISKSHRTCPSLFCQSRIKQKKSPGCKKNKTKQIDLESLSFFLFKGCFFVFTYGVKNFVDYFVPEAEDTKTEYQREHWHKHQAEGLGLQGSHFDNLFDLPFPNFRFQVNWGEDWRVTEILQKIVCDHILCFQLLKLYQDDSVRPDFPVRWSPQKININTELLSNHCLLSPAVPG